MARKLAEQIIKEDTRTPEQKLQSLLPRMYAAKLVLDDAEAEVEKYKSQIKEIMGTNSLPEFVFDDIKALYITSEKVTFNEEMLIGTLKELKTKGIVKKKEYVDMDALELAIYHGKLNAAELSKCQNVKTITTLKVSKLKKSERVN